MAISICVFCGSRYGADPRFRAASTRFGELAGNAQIRLIYGGGHVGLMGAVADAAIAAGGEVTGLIPTRLLEREVGHRAITELVVTQDMFERKQQIADRARRPRGRAEVRRPERAHALPHGRCDRGGPAGARRRAAARRALAGGARRVGAGQLFWPLPTIGLGTGSPPPWDWAWASACC
ncbi:MAG: yvdD [Geminicoccaceae bacterium]|nr:yvdD [Geminicoccaceae bacterium]